MLVQLANRRKLLEKLELAKVNGWEVDSWIEEYKGKLENAQVFREVFQKYCWDTQGVEGIKIAKRFVSQEPISRIHECVLATLALEAEPVDPRL